MRLILRAIEDCGHIGNIKRLNDAYSDALNTVASDIRKLILVCEKVEGQ